MPSFNGDGVVSICDSIFNHDDGRNNLEDWTSSNENDEDFDDEDFNDEDFDDKDWDEDWDEDFDDEDFDDDLDDEGAF